MRTTVLESCGSTNDEAWARHDGTEPLLIVAHSQTGGRGRQGRTWQSADKGNLYTSLWIPPLAEPSLAALLPLLAGVAASLTIEGFWPEARDRGARLKWPNDIMVGNAKCGGVLCESRWNGGRMSGIVIGLGLNLRHAPAVTDREVTSLSAAGYATPLPAEAWGETWARHLIDLVAELGKDGPARSLARWQTFARLDEFPNFQTHDGASVRHFHALGLDDQGRLRVRDASTGAEYLLDQAQ